MINMLYIINYVQVASNNSYGLMIPTPNNNDNCCHSPCWRSDRM